MIDRFTWSWKYISPYALFVRLEVDVIHKDTFIQNLNCRSAFIFKDGVLESITEKKQDI